MACEPSAVVVREARAADTGARRAGFVVADDAAGDDRLLVRPTRSA